MNKVLEETIFDMVGEVYEMNTRLSMIDATLCAILNRLPADGIKTMDTFNDEAPDWLIPGYIVRNELNVLTGVGTDAVWRSIVAGISSGNTTILDREPVFRDAEEVMLFSANDSVEYSIKRLLQKSGANEANIFTMDLSDPKFDQIKIGSKFFEEQINIYRPALCILDPFRYFVYAEDARDALDSLQRLASVYEVTFLVADHRDVIPILWDQAGSILEVGETADGRHYIKQKKSPLGQLSETIYFDGLPALRSTSEEDVHDGSIGG